MKQKKTIAVQITNILSALFLLLSIFHSVYLHAEVTFEIKGISSDEKTNVAIYLAALPPPNNADNDDFLLEVKNSAQSALSVFGYYQPIIEIDVISENTTEIVTLQIDVGPETYITSSDIKIIGEGKDSIHFKALVDSFALKEGDVLQHSHYEDAKSRLKSLARRYGYFDANYEKSQVDVLSLSNSAAVYLWFNTGPRYQFGELVFRAELPADKFVHSLMNFKVGDPFDSRKLSEFNADLSETGYFKNMTILPEFKDKQGLLIPLNVIATMRPQDSFNAGFGYSTDDGIRGKLRWTRPWVNEYGHSIEGNLVASIPKQETSFIYKIPLEDPLYNYVSLQTGYKLLDQNDTDTTQLLLGVNRHWRLKHDWMRTVFVRYEYEQGLQGQQDFSTSLILPGISYRRTRAGGINSTWGDKLMASFEIANEWWLSSDDLIKLYGQAKIMRSFANHQFVVSAELGAIQTDSIYNVPSSMRFFTGGDQSIRGFDYESIAPEDSQGYLIGGRYLTVGSLEYRFPIVDNWKFALFTDFGTATDDFSEVLSSSAGAGVVWASPVGPIRFYVAKPITNELNSFGIHFMIGPEL